ncbi:serine/threonine protein kinase with WD-40 repeats [Tolypothrix sp. NIES-4075]|uniref:serine/threonine-protein kinase n=1 Tax=Tolypothrix sp. NIES-4075 TaxID=2005459 RepID=UPI000B5C1F69|nr:serine/threonine-protein kinase [Tolypothrix sp. NIES-4075]GAX43656.1 serine/threonine protein kinase with WD-40 repeats [Tolypothrix sp. NIES-4075]
MTYCLNPDCQKPQNPDATKFCLTCGSQLLLKNQYQAIQPISQGGFGRTFLAVDAYRLNARCVIKQFFPLPEIQGNSQAMAKATELFEQEARQLLQLGEQHPQIPTLFAYFEQDKRLYLVQQFIDGQDLSQELAQRGAFSESQIRELLHDLLPVLQFVHQQQVIHRDIKPTNILRRQIDGKLVLIDFGVAKQLIDTALTKTGTKAGTQGYAAMEQLRSGKAYPASDLYSLGVTCIHLLTQVEVDELYDPLEGKWLWREHLRQKGKDVSTQLSQVLDKLLKDYVKERYQSVNEVLAALKQVTTPTAKSNYTPKPAPIIVSLRPKPRNWQLVYTLQGHSDLVRAVAISPDGETLASGSNDNSIKLWNLATGQIIRTLQWHSDWVCSLAISPDGITLASGSADNNIKLWNLATGWEMSNLDKHSNSVRSVAISPDGVILASGSGDNTIKLWNLATGQQIRTLEGHSYPVNSVAISPDSNIVASGSVDRTIKLWNLATGQQIRTFRGHSAWVYSVALSPDGVTLASACVDNTIKLWRITTGQEIRTLKGHSDSVRCVALSRDGATLASGSDDNSIKLWNLATGQEIRTLHGHSSLVYSVAFSPDGMTLASGSADNTIKIWQCD